MGPPQTLGYSKQSHGQEAGSNLDPQAPSIQDTEDQELLKNTPGHGTYTPLEESPTEKSNDALINTTGKDSDKGHDKEDNRAEGEKGRFLGFTRREIGIVLMMGLVEFSVQAFLSLMGPFYTIRAQVKGVSATEVGLIFGIVPLVSLLLSPLFGAYIKHIGVKFLLVAGIMTAGCCSILFGFVDWVEDPVAYTVLCFFVRGVEGLAAAAGYTAVFSLLANTFPERLATISAFIEAMSGIGFIMGAPIGGALYEAGGFLLPFILCGAFMILVGLVLWGAAPSPQGDNVRCESRWSLLWRPRVLLALLNLVGGIGTVGFILSRSGEFIASEFMFSPLQVSVVYFCSSGSYLLGTLLWGVLAEWQPKSAPVIFSVGYLSAGILLMFLGPAPFLPFPSDIRLFMVCSCLIAIGLSAGLIAFQIVGTEATEMYGSSLDTSGWVGGVLAAGFNLGEFLGPVSTGFMHDILGFPWTCVCVGSLLLLLASVQLLTHVISNCQSCAKPKEGEMVPFANMADKGSTKYTE